MQVYEIRLLKDDRYSARFIMERMYLNDHAAIRAASQLAKGLPFEVWRGLECVYGLASDRPAIQQAISAPVTRE
jgi:hypothetical protein